LIGFGIPRFHWAVVTRSIFLVVLKSMQIQKVLRWPYLPWLLLCCTVAALGLIVLRPPRALFQLFGHFSPGATYFTNTDQPIVALTIDDGPDAQTTNRILDVLDRHQVQATFFIITDRIPGNEQVLRRMLAAGHELGNHTTADVHSIGLSTVAFEQDLVKADAILKTFTQPRWFRPAGGWHNSEMISIAKKYHYQVVLGSIFPYDTNVSSPWFTTQFITVNAQPGGIIVVHDSGNWGKNTAEALDQLLPKLKQQGYRVVNLTTLVAASQ
jgi:peptidoglycan-N-acetylglucosamine deacetylase